MQHLLQQHLSFRYQKGPIYFVTSATYTSGLRYEIQRRKLPSRSKRLPTSNIEQAVVSEKWANYFREYL
jgi:hypothetical protein